jgi:hypothetical protein
MLAAALLVAACGATDGGEAASPAAEGNPAASASPSMPTREKSGSETPQPALMRTRLSEEITHVHGLAVDDSGMLRAGTHEGVRVVGPDGQVSAVGPENDLMGMTGEPGTLRLVSSGHPGPSSPMPNPLGLIRSDDGGKTWRALSLAGEIDFHALAVTGDFVVGFDGVQGLRASTDGGKTWDQKAALGAMSLAVVGDQVWATTPDGLLRSTDRAATFAAVPDAPLLWQVSAGVDGALWGADTDGVAWRSKDGVTWERHEQLPQMQAIAAVDYDTAYAINQIELVSLTG